MLAQPFLTDLDTRAQVKGSVDPLGAVPIWTRLGRRVVGNLSTVTTSVKDFKTVVLGFALIRDLTRSAGPEGSVDDLAAFLRWEQLAAYTRALAGDWAFRGFRRVRRRLAEGRVVPISAERDCQILGNQKVYGLWGLFSVPSRASGLLEKEVNELTQAADDFVNHTWKRSLTPVWNELLEAIDNDTRRFNLERRESLTRRLRIVWTRLLDNERPFWVDHLVRGGPMDRTAGRQATLARLLQKIAAHPDFTLTQRTIRQLARLAEREDEQLAQCLLDIAASESVLAYADALFRYLQTLDGRPIATAANAVRRAWSRGLAMVDRDGFAALRAELAAATGSPRVANEWVELSSDLAEGR